MASNITFRVLIPSPNPANRSDTSAASRRTRNLRAPAPLPRRALLPIRKGIFNPIWAESLPVLPRAVGPWFKEQEAGIEAELQLPRCGAATYFSILRDFLLPEGVTR